MPSPLSIIPSFLWHQVSKPFLDCQTHGKLFQVHRDFFAIFNPAYGKDVFLDKLSRNDQGKIIIKYKAPKHWTQLEHKLVVTDLDDAVQSVDRLHHLCINSKIELKGNHMLNCDCKYLNIVGVGDETKIEIQANRSRTRTFKRATFTNVTINQSFVFLYASTLIFERCVVQCSRLHLNIGQVTINNSYIIRNTTFLHYNQNDTKCTITGNVFIHSELEICDYLDEALEVVFENNAMITSYDNERSLVLHLNNGSSSIKNNMIIGSGVAITLFISDNKPYTSSANQHVISNNLIRYQRIALHVSNGNHVRMIDNDIGFYVELIDDGSDEDDSDGSDSDFDYEDADNSASDDEADVKPKSFFNAVNRMEEHMELTKPKPRRSCNDHDDGIDCFDKKQSKRIVKETNDYKHAQGIAIVREGKDVVK